MYSIPHHRHLRACQLLLISFVLVLFSIKSASGQAVYNTLQDVKPPSPEAISMVKQGFTDVSLYTGKINYGIPLYTLSQNGVSVPVSLSYGGGGGIKVEEVASSVGLGWSLQSTGVVTRSTRGMVDDVDNMGYIHLPGFDSTIFHPTTPDFDMVNEYKLGRYDSQPDQFYLNAPGLSAMFYITKLKQVVFIEKSDLKVKINFSTYTNRITGFEVKDLNGNIYIFDVVEKNKSVSLSSGSYGWYDDSDDVSAWYLSSIKDVNNNVLFTFQYTTGLAIVETTQYTRAPKQFSIQDEFQFNEDNSTYTVLYNKRPVLQKITGTAGEIRFVMSTSKRDDFAEDRALDSIIVKNYLGETIRKFNFDYTYFSGSGVVNQAPIYAAGDPALRLKLDVVEVFGGAGSTKEVYSFTYNTQQLLPNRLTSYAMDHWGFYNGQTTNTSWEPKYRAQYYTSGETIGGTPVNHLKEFGTANREANATYAQACILKEVTTPMGGKIQFEYEGNTSNHPDLPNTVTQVQLFSSAYTPDDQKQYFTIGMIREPFSNVRLSSPINSSGVKIEYIIRDSLESSTYIIDTLEFGSNMQIKKVHNGVHYLKARIISYSSDPGYFYTIALQHDVETLQINKPVGGVRIKQMKLVNPGGEVYTRNYYYNESGNSDTNSLSTGVISSVPRYGYQHIELFSSDYVPGFWSTYFGNASTYVRQLSSTYPLISSSGSYVGYRKTTTIDSDQLKSESHFTTFEDFPQYADGYLKNRGFWPAEAEGGGVTVAGKWYELTPFAPADERDYFRGKLLKEVVYRKEAGTFKKVSSTENQHIFNYGIDLSKTKRAISPTYVYDSESMGHVPPDTLDLLPFESVEGVIFMALSGGSSNVKSYRLHSGKFDLGKTVQKSFTYNGVQVDSLTVQQTFDYGQAPGSRDDNYHYVVTKVTTQTSTGSDTSRFYYPFDWRYANANISVSDTSFLRTLEKQNRIGTPFMELKKSDNLHQSTTKNRYSTFNSRLLSSGIDIKADVQPAFEERIRFNEYDALGNILEQQKSDDQKLSYLWGYKNSYVIAEVVNAAYNQIAYTSFEPDSKGSWTHSGSGALDATAPTGAYSFTLTGNMTKTGVGTGTFIVSYWKKSGTITVNSTSGTAREIINGWTRYEHVITNPGSGTITVTGSGAVIDELRLHPVTAQMTTYTYKPLVGMTGSMDTNGQSMTYEYDSFGRLTVVRDRDRNILKRTQYHLKGQ